MELLDKILIANRGEIALRIIRSAKKLGIRSVAIYTETESKADYVRLADESVSLGSGDLSSTFLNIQKIIHIAVSTGTQAIHPGYGFLSENPAFAKACEENQLIFIGPSSDVLRLMSSKPAAKQLAENLGIPVIFSQKINLQIPVPDDNQLHYPILLKASYGGGGKGMELIRNHPELIAKMKKSARTALNCFGNGELFIENYIPNARHVEVQILGDNFHNIIHLYERECSIQRNHQKIIEEAPAVFLPSELRDKILRAAVKIGKAVNYSGAGTVEFLVNETGDFFFIEMNPRIQVEHGITEEITGIDIVSEQLRIASGFPLSVSQNEVKLTGHAIELRVYAENPAQNFSPSAIPLLSVNLPENHELRIESDLRINQSSKNQFDPLLLKLIAFEKDRISAIRILGDNIRNLNIIGPITNTKYLETILAHPDFVQNKISVEFCKNNHILFIDSYITELSSFRLANLVSLALCRMYLKIDSGDAIDPWNYLGYWRVPENIIHLSIDGKIYPVTPVLNNKSHPAFVLNGVRTNFRVVRRLGNNVDLSIDNQTSRISAIFENQNRLSISYENIGHNLSFPGLLNTYPDILTVSDDGAKLNNGEVQSPLHGRILEINIIENQIIKKGDLLMVIEAMKSENRILSPRDAKVRKIAVNVGTQVTDRTPLLFLEDCK